MLHDSLGCVALWRDFPAQLAAHSGRSVIAYDRLGFGRSDPFVGKLPLNFVAKEATTSFAALRQQLNIERFVVLGHSVGGGMAVHCAAHNTHHCDALVTIAAQAFVEDRTVRGIEQARVAFGQHEQMARLRRYHGDKAQWVLNSWIETWLSSEFADWSLSDTLHKVSSPALVMHGADDEYGSARHPQLIGQQLGGPVRVELMPATRHMPHRERPDEVLKAVSAFLATCA